MENNFDITKIYTETENKKKIGISSIFSIFIGKGKDKKKVENIEKPKKDDLKPKRNMKIQERSRAYEEYIKKKKIKQRDTRTKFFLFIFLGILLISMPMYIIFKSAESDELFKKVNKEVEELLEEQGVEKTLGYIHIFDSKKKEILKNKYGIDWKTTSEMNPDVYLD